MAFVTNGSAVLDLSESDTLSINLKEIAPAGSNSIVCEVIPENTVRVAFGDSVVICPAGKGTFINIQEDADKVNVEVLGDSVIFEGSVIFNFGVFRG